MSIVLFFSIWKLWPRYSIYSSLLIDSYCSLDFYTWCLFYPWYIYHPITLYWTVPLTLDHSSRWVINKLENCWYKSVRVLEVPKLLFQQFLNLSSTQRDMGGPILGALSNNRWSGGTSTESCIVFFKDIIGRCCLFCIHAAFILSLKEIQMDTAFYYWYKIYFEKKNTALSKGHFNSVGVCFLCTVFLSWIWKLV